MYLQYKLLRFKYTQIKYVDIVFWTLRNSRKYIHIIGWIKIKQGKIKQWINPYTD